MKVKSLNILRCPACVSTTACQGEYATGVLKLTEGAAKCPKNSRDEITEGFLTCQRCKREFPIISGVAILTPEPQAHISRFYQSILASTMEHGYLSETMLDYMKSFNCEFPVAAQMDNNRGNYGMYIHNHFPEMDVDDDPIDTEFRNYLLHIKENNYQNSLLKMIDALPGGRKLAIDIGCNVGGLTSELSARFESVIGFDYSFHSTLLARKILLHKPERLRQYKIFKDLNSVETKNLGSKLVSNVEFVVANALHPPLPSACADLVNSANVIDEIDSASLFIREKSRLAKPGGFISLCTSFSIPGLPLPWFVVGPSWLKGLLLCEGLKIMEMRDNLPRVLRSYNRCYSVFFCQCVIAAKSEVSK